MSHASVEHPHRQVCLPACRPRQHHSQLTRLPPLVSAPHGGPWFETGCAGGDQTRPRTLGGSQGSAEQRTSDITAPGGMQPGQHEAHGARQVIPKAEVRAPLQRSQSRACQQRLHLCVAGVAAGVVRSATHRLRQAREVLIPHDLARQVRAQALISATPKEQSQVHTVDAGTPRVLTAVCSRRAHMLECTRCREGSVPSWSDSISSEYAHKPPTSSAACSWSAQQQVRMSPGQAAIQVVSQPRLISVFRAHICC